MRIGRDLGRGVAAGVDAASEGVARSAERMVDRASSRGRRAAQRGARVISGPLGRVIADENVLRRTFDQAAVARASSAAAAQVVGVFGREVEVRMLGFRGRISTTFSRTLRDAAVSARSNLASIAEQIGSSIGDLIDRAVSGSVRMAIARAARTRPELAMTEAQREAEIASIRRRMTDIELAEQSASLARQEQDALIAIAEAHIRGNRAARAELAFWESRIARRTEAEKLAMTDLQRQAEAAKLARLRSQIERPALDEEIALDEIRRQREIDALRRREEQINAIGEAIAEIRSAEEERLAGQREAITTTLGALVDSLNRGLISQREFIVRFSRVTSSLIPIMNLAGQDAAAAFNQALGASLVRGRIGDVLIGASRRGIDDLSSALMAQMRQIVTGPGLPRVLAGGVRPEIVSPRAAALQEAVTVRDAIRSAIQSRIDALRTRIQDLRSRDEREQRRQGERQIAELQKILTAILSQPDPVLLRQIVIARPGEDPETVAARAAEGIVRRAVRRSRRRR